MAKKNQKKQISQKTKIAVIAFGILFIVMLAILAFLLFDKTNKNNFPPSQKPEVHVNIETAEVADLLVIENVEDELLSSLEMGTVQEHLTMVEAEGFNSMELAGLYYMEEEEKLAHDLYVALGELWNIKSFENISKAEATHTNSTVAVLEAYNYPSKQSSELGVFNNIELQALYDTLLTDGSVSSLDALMVGAMVEEVDIIDLDKYIGQTKNTDLITLYTNLKRGSENHLRAFVKNYQRSGNVYYPQFLNLEYYNAVIAQ